MYQAHFGVLGEPFANVPDTHRFFPGAKRGAILDALIYAIERGEGIVKVVGEVGTGKTMLCRMLADTLPAHIEVVYLANPSLSPDTILHAIAAELKLVNVTPATSKLEVLQALQAYLLQRHANDRQVVMLVEEAQCMPLATLEEIRLLSNLETHRHKLLQIVLFGQPELDEKLALPSMRQLRERISHRFHLEPFDQNDVNDYLNFKLKAAGDSAPGLFSARAGRAVHRYSQGLVRRVNFLADKTLLAAFSENALTVEPRHVRRAARDCEFAGTAASPIKYFAIGCALAVATLVAWQWISRAPVRQVAATPATTSAPSVATHTESPLRSMTDVPLPLSAFEAALHQASQEIATSSTPRRASPVRPSASTALRSAVALDRLGATENWAPTAANKLFTAQIMTTFENRENEVRGLERLMAGAAVTPWLEHLYLHRGAIDGKPVLVLTLGGFDSARAARSAVTTLPPELTRFQPLVRSLGSLRAEIGTGSDREQTR